ncbi:hypothetical protein CE91St18_02360 [Alistipes onderdonkii]|nr:hypothetical protein CE91St18_02360 [Alistipes onderdonkii]
MLLSGIKLIASKQSPWIIFADDVISSEIKVIIFYTNTVSNNKGTFNLQK